MPCWHNTKNVCIPIVINSSHHVCSVSATIIFRNEVISLLPFLSEKHNTVLFAKIYGSDVYEYIKCLSDPTRTITLENYRIYKQILCCIVITMIYPYDKLDNLMFPLTVK